MRPGSRIELKPFLYGLAFEDATEAVSVPHSPLNRDASVFLSPTNSIANSSASESAYRARELAQKDGGGTLILVGVEPFRDRLATSDTRHRSRARIRLPMALGRRGHTAATGERGRRSRIVVSGVRAKEPGDGRAHGAPRDVAEAAFLVGEILTSGSAFEYLRPRQRARTPFGPGQDGHEPVMRDNGASATRNGTRRVCRQFRRRLDARVSG